jgi:parvulin-like peptidyl-prolyl isomerase
MAQLLKFGNRTISATELPHLLAGNQMLPILCRQLIINQGIVGIKLTEEETAHASQSFFAKNQIESEEARLGFIQYYSMSLEQLEELATRELRIEKFKQATWGSRVESYFLANKSQFDKVVYSLIRVSEMEVAQELFFRIQAGEASFNDSAFEYSEGQEAQTGGLIGPVELSMPHPTIASMLSTSTPGELLAPTKLGEWFVILRLEKIIKAQLDETMRQHLLNHMFETWIAQEMKHSPVSICSENEDGSSIKKADFSENNHGQTDKFPNLTFSSNSETKVAISQ